MLCIVEVGETVDETRPTLEHRRRRLPSHARITVGSPGGNAFEESTQRMPPTRSSAATKCISLVMRL
jgi:hypothetical protein